MPTSSAANNNHFDLLRPAQATAAEFRHECANLVQLAEELFSEAENLRQQLEAKADELDEGKRRLAERGRQLAEQRKESGRLTHVLEQQETRLGEALAELKALRQQIADERELAHRRETEQTGALAERLRATEAERDQLRHEMHVLQAAASANGSGASVDALAPLLTELGDLRRQLSDAQQQLMATHQELGSTRLELSTAIDRASAAAQAASAAVPQPGAADDPAVSAAAAARLEELHRERIELESELELVRTRATELQETVQQQKRELVEQRAELSGEMRLLRELVEQFGERWHEGSGAMAEPALAGAGVRHAAPAEAAAPADPVINSVMAQFARLQKDVAQRRKKK